MLTHLESFGSFADDAWLAVRYAGFSPSTVGTVNGYHGGNALASEAASGTVATLIVPTDDEYTVGIRWRMMGTADSGSGHMAITFRLAGVGDQFTLRAVHVSAASDEWRLELRRGGVAGTVVATQTQAQHLGAWHYIEFQCLADTSSGEYEVRVDGVALAELSDTGVDTAGSASNDIDRVDISIHQDAEVCDIYVLNNAGGSNDDFLGPIHVQSIRPSADGNQNDWTPSTGNNFSTVDELGTGGLGTDYNASSVTTDVDLYEYGNATRIRGASVTIPGVELVSLMALDTGTGPEDVAHTMRSGGLEADKAGQSVTSTSQAAFSDVWETNEAESTAWTVADLDVVEFGVENVT